MLRQLLGQVFLALFVGSAFATQKPTVVLVHGAFQDESAWAEVKSKLEGSEFKVVTVNLPGREPDATPVESISLDLYRRTVLDAVSDEKEPVVLVGHSFGGMTIANVAEGAPEKIKALVFLAAYLPRNGDSLQTLAQTDKDSLLGRPGNLQISANHRWARIKNTVKADIFANDARCKHATAVVASLLPEPLAPLGTPVTLGQRFDSVPKFYIMTTRDKAVSADLQSRMVNGAQQVRKVTKIDAGHAAYATRPAKVAKAIEEAALYR